MVDVGLEIKHARTGDLLCRLDYIRDFELRNDRHAELVRDPVLSHEIRGGLAELRGVGGARRRHLVILLERRLDVHCDVIEKSAFHPLFHHFGAHAVGVELDLHTYGAEFLGEIEKVGLKSRLSAGDDHSVKQKIVLYAREYRVVGKKLLGVEDLGVVAVPAPEVAPAHENYRRDVAGKINETVGIVTCYSHIRSLLSEPPRD